jgi:hypothetical protein
MLLYGEIVVDNGTGEITGTAMRAVDTFYNRSPGS